MEHRKRKSQMLRNLRRQGMSTAALLLAVVILFTSLNLIVKDKESSSAENRKLAQKPALSMEALKDGSYAEDMAAYTADQFVGRNGWISINRQFSRLLGQKEAGGVYFGKNKYLLEAPAIPDRAALTRNLNAINAFAERHSDLTLNMTIVPNAATVLSDKLPSHAPVHDQTRDLAAIQAELESVQFLSVQEALEAHKEEPIFYHTDHHWTSLGASYAFEAMAEGMGITPSGAGYNIYPVSNNFEGTLASKSGSHKILDVIEVYVPKDVPAYYFVREGESEKHVSLFDAEKLNGKDQYAMFLGGNTARLDITTAAQSGRNLLIFKDSYANCFVSFLLPYYDRIIMLDPRYYYGSADDVVSREKITDVLFLYNTNTFVKDSVLADTLTP